MSIKLTSRRVQCPRCKELYTAAIRATVRGKQFGFPQLYHPVCLSAQCLDRQRAFEEKQRG